MAIRIVGVDLPQNKRGEIALTYIYGIDTTLMRIFNPCTPPKMPVYFRICE